MLKVEGLPKGVLGYVKVCKILMELGSRNKGEPACCLEIMCAACAEITISAEIS